jgi:adhesin transport system membrane fusion protein
MTTRKSLGARVMGHRISLVGVLLLMACFMGWASQAHLDQITRAPGKVIAVARTQSIQSPDGGVVREILVREGEAVRRGQLLVRMDDSKARAAVGEAQSKVAALRTALERLRAEMSDQPLRFSAGLTEYEDFRRNQTQLYERRREALRADLATLGEAVRLAGEEVKMNEPLAHAGDIAPVDMLRLRRAANEASGQLASRRNKYYQDVQSDLAKAEEDLAAAEEVLADRQALLDHTELRAPMDGVVNLITQTTVGAVLRPGDEILQMLPSGDELIVEAKVKAADIGFIRLWHPATVKLDAYDYSIYGVLEGTVSYISSDALVERGPQGTELSYYRVRIRISGARLKGEKGKALQLQPGLTTMVEIVTGSNTVLGYLTKPVTKTVSESFTER